MQSNYEDSINILQTQWLEADTDQRFAIGDQQIWNQIYPNTPFRRKLFNFNIINSLIQSITGHQRQTRKSSICIPVANQMQKTADQLTKCLYYVHDKGNIYSIYSDAFEQGALTQGIGLIRFFMDYSDDPISGDIRARYIDFKSVLIDPFFRMKDLSDCRFIQTRQYFSKEEAMVIYPDHVDELMKTPEGKYQDEKFYYMPEVYQIMSPNTIAIDEYWYLTHRQAYFAIDTLTNETKELAGDEEDVRIIQKKFGNRLKIEKRPKRTIGRAVLVNNRVMIDEMSPWGLDRYPFVASLGYFTPDTPYYAYKFRGVVRDMRDAQYLLNRRKVSDLDIIESQQQGLKVKKGALLTPDDSLNVGHGRVLVINDKMQMTDVEKMPIDPPSPILLQMEEMLEKMMYKIVGVDPAAMGIEVDDKAGIISMMRQAATTRNLQRLFDQFDEMQREAGDIIINLIQKNWTYGKVKQVIHDEPTEEFDHKAFFQYGAKVVQGHLTETQNQLELAQLLQLQQMFGNIFPMEEIVNVMTIQNKDRIIEKMVQAQKAQAEQAQKMQELQMQQIQVDNQTKLSYAEGQKSLGRERIAKIEVDAAVAKDKLKRANTEDTAALLNVIRSLKELDSLDLQQIEKKLQLLNLLNPVVHDEIVQPKQEVNL